jgi:hypothetical protein
VRLEAGIVPVVPSPVVAQLSRPAGQVQLRRLLRGCEIAALTGEAAHSAGYLLRRADASDVVDAVVADTAARLRADVVTAPTSPGSWTPRARTCPSSTSGHGIAAVAAGS